MTVLGVQVFTHVFFCLGIFTALSANHSGTVTATGVVTIFAHENHHSTEPDVGQSDALRKPDDWKASVNGNQVVASFDHGGHVQFKGDQAHSPPRLTRRSVPIGGESASLDTIGTSPRTSRSMIRRERKASKRRSHGVQRPVNVDDAADTQRHAAAGGGENEIQVSPTSMLEMSTWSKVKSIARDVSTGTLIVSVLLSFTCGILLTVLFILSLKRPAQQVFEELAEEVKETCNAQQYDFKIEDPKDHKIHYYEWLPEAEIQELGLAYQAPTKPFENYKRIDVAPSNKVVEDMLSSSNVDFTEFNRRTDLSSLLWRLLRSECFFMSLSDGSKVLLMVESVRIRWLYNGRILIQESGDSFLGANASFPSVEKPTSESPSCAAQRLWAEVLKMPEGSATFVEVSMDDAEIDGYKGLRCVERCHLMDMKLAVSDPEILAKCGLPGHSSFSVTDLQDNEVGGHCVREFKWMTVDECDQIGVNTGNMKTAMNVDVRGVSLAAVNRHGVENGLDNLRQYLTDSGVETDKWEKGQTNKLQALSKELSSGKCFLSKSSSGMHRCVNVVCLRLWSPDRKFLLVDRGRGISGDTDWSPQLPGSKKDLRENLTDCTARICSELELKEEDVEYPTDVCWEYFDYTEISGRYIGLLTKYQKFFVDVIINDSDDLLKRVGLEGKLEAQPPDGA